MSHLFEEFLSEFKSLQIKKHEENFEGINRLINDTNSLLNKTYFLISNELQNSLVRLFQRAKEPMKVAITGQFSSGKSTFLNALLSKNILPTGITPVTSKVNYIRYKDEYIVQVKYKDGRVVFHDAKNIANFTDQRGEVEDIDYLTLFAPLPLLKDIVFVDTPGLNSQSMNDTLETEKVLKDVDGIIWLSLIDNAGKMSETEVLEKYLNAYKNKSLCVLNQKDKFTPEQVIQTTKYVQETFKNYFSEFISISAREALISRSHDREIMLENELENMVQTLKENIKNSEFNLKKEQIQSFFDEFSQRKEKILNADIIKNKELLKSSNIEAVLKFIYQEIQPTANISRDYAITKDIENILNILILQEDKMIKVFESLEDILEDYEKEASLKFEELKRKFAKELNESFSKIEEIIEKIATEILLHVKKTKRVRFVKQKEKLFNKKEQFLSIEYDAPKINSDEVYKKLFYDDNLIGKMFKGYLKSLDEIEQKINKENLNVFKSLEEKIIKWQKPYENIRKNEALESDKQYANIRKFASKTYENILKSYNDEIANSYAKISSEFKYLGSALQFNYQNATEVVVAFLESKIEKSVKLYEENPTEFNIYEPKFDDIKSRLHTSFYMYEIENMMQDKKSFVTKNYERLLNKFVKIKNERLEIINLYKIEYVKLKSELEEFIKINLK